MTTVQLTLYIASALVAVAVVVNLVYQLRKIKRDYAVKKAALDEKYRIEREEFEAWRKEVEDFLRRELKTEPRVWRDSPHRSDPR